MAELAARVDQAEEALTDAKFKLALLKERRIQLVAEMSQVDGKIETETENVRQLRLDVEDARGSLTDDNACD